MAKKEWESVYYEQKPSGACRGEEREEESEKVKEPGHTEGTTGEGR